MSSIKDFEFYRDIALKSVEYGRSLDVDFIDVRIEYLDSSSIEIENGIVRVARQGVDLGVAVRVLYQGYWGFSTTNRLDIESIKRAVDNAYRAAKAMAVKGRGDRAVELLPPRRDSYVDKVVVDPRSIALEDKVKDLLTLNNELAKDSRVKYVGLRYLDAYVVKIYASSDDRDILQNLCYVWSYVWATAREGDVVASVREEIGARDGYTLWRRWPQYDLAKKLLDRIDKQLHAKTPKGGVFPAVLAPNVVGVFVHEAFGHLAEADLTLSGSAVRDKLGVKIASELVTIVDDPSIEGGFGTFRYDDEGVETRRAVLIERGVVKELMVDREHAYKLKQTPTGNARAESFRVPPLIRMRNTIMLPGDYSVEELFEGIEFGYYLVAFRGGQANLDGTFQVGVQEAYEIVNGRIGEPVRNLSISGNTLETLALVDAVAKDFELGFGRCGKGQTAFVSDGGPHVRVKKIVVGGQAV